MVFRHKRLTKVTITPGNPRYICCDDKFVCGKSSLEKDDYDVLVFCNRSIQDDITLPNFVSIIDEYAFDRCKLKSLRIPVETKLQIIDDCAFCLSNIKTQLINLVLLIINHFKVIKFFKAKLKNFSYNMLNAYPLVISEFFI